MGFPSRMFQHACHHLCPGSFSPAYSLCRLDKMFSLTRGCIMLCERGMASEVNLDEIVGIYTSQVRPYQGPLLAESPHAVHQQSSWQ